MCIRATNTEHCLTIYKFLNIKMVYLLHVCPYSYRASLAMLMHCHQRDSFCAHSVIPSSQDLVSLKMRLEKYQQFWQCFLVVCHAKISGFHAPSRVQCTLGHIIPKYATFEQNAPCNIRMFPDFRKLYSF